MVFNILIDNTDDHEKNHTLMVVAPTRQGKYRLAPAYDVLTTNSGQGYQEARWRQVLPCKRGCSPSRPQRCAERVGTIKRPGD